jgi:dihydroorotate dehydrogenase
VRPPASGAGGGRSAGSPTPRLAAGYDKNGLALHGLACLGFGHLELRTVTPAAQPGNPPAVFRLPGTGLINRLGFPNAARRHRGLGAAADDQAWSGVNIGKKRRRRGTGGRDFVALERF